MFSDCYKVAVVDNFDSGKLLWKSIFNIAGDKTKHTINVNVLAGMTCYCQASVNSAKKNKKQEYSWPSLAHLAEVI